MNLIEHLRRQLAGAPLGAHRDHRPILRQGGGPRRHHRSIAGAQAVVGVDVQAAGNRPLGAFGCGPLQVLDRAGALGERTSLAHCVWVTPASSKSGIGEIPLPSRQFAAGLWTTTHPRSAMT